MWKITVEGICKATPVLIVWLMESACFVRQGGTTLQDDIIASIHAYAFARVKLALNPPLREVRPMVVQRCRAARPQNYVCAILSTWARNRDAFGGVLVTLYHPLGRHSPLVVGGSGRARPRENVLSTAHVATRDRNAFVWALAALYHAVRRVRRGRCVCWSQRRSWRWNRRWRRRQDATIEASVTLVTDTNAAVSVVCVGRGAVGAAINGSVAKELELGVYAHKVVLDVTVIALQVSGGLEVSAASDVGANRTVKSCAARAHRGGVGLVAPRRGA